MNRKGENKHYSRKYKTLKVRMPSWPMRSREVNRVSKARCKRLLGWNNRRSFRIFRFSPCIAHSLKFVMPNWRGRDNTKSAPFLMGEAVWTTPRNLSQLSNLSSAKLRGLMVKQWRKHVCCISTPLKPSFSGLTSSTSHTLWCWFALRKKRLSQSIRSLQ